MPRIRTFIALDTGKAIRDRLASLQGTLAQSGAEVKWVEKKNLHLTLLFLGEVEDRELIDVCRAVADVAGRHKPIELCIERAGCFPNPRRPRVLWVGVGKGAQEVCALHDDLEKPLLELGCYRREERQYTPHLTLGRVKSERPMDKLAAALQKEQGFSAGETVLREVHVMSSHLTPQGPEYTVMSRAKLGAPS
ncbi:MAG: RNA 2',3'-cyclic phosphodiesterase [Gemmataceae bacterium]|nr:RNA 2',3'-cyclic phosphodiesterase [Gemmataceae bacterium]MCI0739165.1 RNA 2',3'-cyclic phosphodiesterase [Gemmataceae bacterium]